MVKASKTTKPTSETPEVVAPVSVVVETKQKKVKQPKQEAAAAPAPAPVVAAPVSAAPAVEESVELADGETPLAEQSSEFFAKLQQLGSLLSALKTEYRSMEKKWTRELKVAQKQCSKRKRKAGNRAPSGFVKPTRISDELAQFLEKPAGTEMARTEVTRDINKYIRTNNLQDKENGRKINPDAKLAGLLKLQKSDELTYFNLQRFMSPHFSKASVAVVAGAV